MIEQTVDIETRDGAMETFICAPDRGGPFAPILFLMDAPGIREELRDMARRLATSLASSSDAKRSRRARTCS